MAEEGKISKREKTKHFDKRKLSFLLIFTFVFYTLVAPYPNRNSSTKRGIQLIKEGESLVEKTEYEAAEVKFQSALNQSLSRSERKRLYLDLAYVYYCLGKARECEQFLHKLFSIEPNKAIDEDQYPLGFQDKLKKIKRKYPGNVIHAPGKKSSKKKFPTLLVIGGVAALTVILVLLLSGKKSKYRLTVSKGEGVTGEPGSGTYEYKKDETVRYSYGLKSGYTDLYVALDGNTVEAEGQIVMDGNHTLTISTAPPGSINVDSVPPGAAVWLDGTDTGNITPTVLENVLPGSHTISLKLAGYLDYDTTVTVSSGQQETIAATMADTNFGIEWIEIPAGDFKMGDNFNEGKGSERPVHKVYLDCYYISKYEITFEQYDIFCDYTDRKKPDDFGWGRGTMPVVHISWNDAKAFCDWLSEKTGNRIQIPTEAQWEKAARGNTGYRFPWGNNYPDCSMANHSGCEPNNRTVPVGSYPSFVSPYGVHDMAGNAWEYCRDWYSYSYYSDSPYRNPTGPSVGTQRVIRGGSCNGNAYYLRATDRSWDALPSSTTTPDGRTGFRVVMEQ